MKTHSLGLTRREMLTAALGAAIAPRAFALGATPSATPRMKLSVCRGYGRLSLDELCEVCQGLGIASVELVEPPDFGTLQKHGLQCAVARFTSTKLPDTHINCGWSHPEYHEVLLPGYEELIRKTADAGFKKVICMAGQRKGLSERAGLENCAAGLAKLMPLCEKLGVTMVMELLNSKINHPDYLADHTSFGVQLCEKIGSPHFRLLYDVYHMQIMEGDLCATIKAHHPYLGHFHLAGVPGRHEIDETQEINYRAVVRTIAETGYDGFIGFEFSPTRPDRVRSLKQAVEICTAPIS